jgi:hypothetical protein
VPILVGNSLYSFSFESQGIGKELKEFKELQIFPIITFFFGAKDLERNFQKESVIPSASYT